jgi:ParB family chromosome partitioning protein
MTDGRKGGLGRGLGALIPTEATTGAASEGTLRDLPIDDIEANRYQPRERFEEASLMALADSIRELGVLQPVLVRESESGYELIAGERRWRAAKRAGLTTIPALVRTADDLASLEQAVVENLHRADLNPLEEAAAYQQLLEDFELTQTTLATRVGKSRSAISNLLRLFQLPGSIQKLVMDGRLAEGHARALLGTPDRQQQERLAQRAVRQGLSVRQVEEAVRALEGDEGGDPPAPKTAALRPPGLLELENLLSDHLATKVTVTMGTRRGRVQIDFADLSDLERIYRAMTEPGSDEEEAG